MDRRRFRIVLAGLTMLGFAVRVAYALAAKVPVGFGDDVWFHSVANGLVHERGFSDPFNSVVNGSLVFSGSGPPLPTAFHPPLFPWLLAIPPRWGSTPTRLTRFSAARWAPRPCP